MNLPAKAQDTSAVKDITAGELKLRWHLQGGVNAVAESNLFWNLSNVFAPSAGFDPDTEWLEFYIKPGISAELPLSDAATLYGKISAVASYTAGTDGFAAADTGRVTLEETYLGLRSGDPASFAYDLSFGSREYKLGTGMLIANGASNGFERGALKFGPRKAWELAAIGEVTVEGTKFSGFFLDPRELDSNDGGNQLLGADARHDFQAGGFLGATYVHVLESGSPYPKAGTPPTVLPGAREGLNAINAYARTNDIPLGSGSVFAAVELAYEWNDRIDMRAWAARAQIGYRFASLPWAPSLAYSYQTFSGDDPATSRLERFDPLYYEGSPAAWATGSKSAMVFINSNAQAHTMTLRMQPSPRDTLTFRYSHIRANELNSPVQFGQATRVQSTGVGGALVTGVTDAHLADDFFVEYSRILSQNLFLTAGLSASVPGEGIEIAAGGDAPVWTGGFVNVVFNY